MTKAETQSTLRSQEHSVPSAWRTLWLIAGAGFIVRLLFMGNEGFRNDVSSFEAWAITLAQHPFWEFYNSTSFADYPPGYFYILALVGHVFTIVSPHNNYDVLKYLVKLPAVLVDLADGVLLFAIVRRFASERIALAVAAAFIFNPAVIFISAAWGQVDSIAGGLSLFAVYQLLRSESRGGTPIVYAWLALTYSLLIKPQAAVLIPLFIVFAFVAPQAQRRGRLIATGAGIAAAIAFTFLLTVPFHPTANPANAFTWLYHKYEFGKNVYAYNSVNAFNLWSAMKPFWQPDSQMIGPWPQYFWGILLVAAATVLVIVRYAGDRSQRALLESAALLTLSFYMLSTRMHERYIYDGLLFTMACIPFARRYVVATIVFSFTLFVNLWYSLTYLGVVTAQTPGVNATDMWPAVTHPLSVLNVGMFFFLGYVYLGQTAEEAQAAQAAPQASDALLAAFARAREWFDPREGLARMAWPLDYVTAGCFGAVSFAVSYVNYWIPFKTDQCWSVIAGVTRCGIFDEIYFARAAEEYLTNKYIYENTHPPLTKLIITFSTILFGGLAHGDNTHGWRFLDVVFGAIAVVVLYAFAKRLTRSTLFSSIAALLFVADGMHFVQSRIATPEGIVIVFSLGTLYAFYRYWIAAQSASRPYEPGTRIRASVACAGALVLGFICGALAATLSPPPHSVASYVVSGLYFAVGWYLVLRLWVVPRFMPAQGEFISYAEGSQIVRDGSSFAFETPDGGAIESSRKTPRTGTLTRAQKLDLAAKDGEADVVYSRDLTVRYSTPEGSAVYSPGLVVDDAGERQDGRHATHWLVVFTLLLGALVASKWYGVMAYGVSFVVVAAVWLQRYYRAGKLKHWGNPFGFRLDVTVAAVLFLSMSVYVAAWIPDFFRHIEIKNVTDLVYRQYTMFEYHDTLKATHPYASAWWTWPLDLRPIAYYWKDFRTGANANNPAACCVSEIVSLPNPLIMWFGLLCVPIVGVLAWREKNKGYALLVLAYLMQWLPWARSPRLAWIYHFYVDVPLIVLCNVIVLQRLWNMESDEPWLQTGRRVLVGAYCAAVVAAFVWFYPILAGTPIPWNAWNARMWLGSHWV